MPERAARSYPPVGDPERLDSILRRGRSLRRRRQMKGAAAGAGGAAAVVAVAVLLVGGGSGGTDDQVVADEVTTTEATTTTTTVPAPAPATMSVDLLSGPARVRVDDPAQPDGDGTQQCVWVRVMDASATSDTDPAVAEGTACAPGLSPDGQADLVLTPTGLTDSAPGVEIGCAADVTNPPPEAVLDDATRPGTTTFTLSAPGLPPGEYRVWASAVSGLGDGCAPAQEPGLEREHVVEVGGSLTLG